MKITPIHVNSVNPYNKQQRKMNATSSISTFADKIEISTTAKEMSTISTDRAQKIQKLKEEIQSGEYQVNARKVAEDMLKYYRY
ncbi:FlgM family anti-sigma-28 factor [Ureibacillus xyleni]|uniref:Negative regulator of flagellin synthesis n=1 Tax=Ureibacillus xyleni TaxID=614648 RepID=A0A285RAV2_9BACL|nr:flagellar biosynthesis anti-sigma factor FlgM [Ureibacillus xyleni]SOB91014.1 FlgM family anti-sigma-28 factor [Ureibacillus xyleni]